MLLPPTPETAAAFFGTYKCGRDPALDVGALRRRRHPPPRDRLAGQGAGHQRGQQGPRRPVAGRARAAARRRAAAERRRRDFDARRHRGRRPGAALLLLAAPPGWPRASSTRTATCSRTRSSSTATTCRTASASTAWASGRGRPASRRCSGRGATARSSSSTSARAASTRTSSSTSSRATRSTQRLHDADRDALDDGDRGRGRALPAEVPHRLLGRRAAEPGGDPLVPRAVRRHRARLLRAHRVLSARAPTTRSWTSARARWASRCRAGTCRSSTRTRSRCRRASAARSACARARTRTIRSATGTTPEDVRGDVRRRLVPHQGRRLARRGRLRLVRGPRRRRDHRRRLPDRPVRGRVGAASSTPAVRRGGGGRLARRAARQRRQGVHRAGRGPGGLGRAGRGDQGASSASACRPTPTRARSSSSTSCRRR